MDLASLFCTVSIVITAEKTSPMMAVAMRVEVRENPLLPVFGGFKLFSE